MIVSLGDAIVDLFALPRGADLASATSFVPRQGGAPANVAVVASRLGARARFVGALGTDAHGTRLLAELEAAGVDTRAVVRLPKRTGVTFVRVTPEGERSFLFYRQGSADLALAPEHLESQPIHPLEDASWLHLASSALVAEPMASAARWMLAAARARRVPVSLDLNVRAHLWPDRERMAREVRALTSLASLVKSSEEDLDALGLPATYDALEALAPSALAVLTLAERGAIVRVGTREIHANAPQVDVVDATGAGDAFVAAVLAALEAKGLLPGAAGFEDPDVWTEVLRFACAVGARAVTALGATEGVRDLSAEREMLRHRG